ncbi:MAG: hypothetical protein ACI4L7_02050 [Christensenellales bacterium]
MVRKKLVKLIFSLCLVAMCSVAAVFYILAATQQGINSKLYVGYTPDVNVVCKVSATYQREKDSSATAFSTNNVDFVYLQNETTGSLTASSSAIELNEYKGSTYVIFEFTFENKNPVSTYHVDISLADTSTVSGFTRTYYFGTLSATTLEAKKTAIKTSGFAQSALTGKTITIGATGTAAATNKVYMLVEISKGVKGSFTSNDTNGLKFTLASRQVT